MSDRDAFLRTVLDAPDDDAPRLVFADWLDEHGEPEEAARIRTQCALAAVPEWDRRWWEVHLATSAWSSDSGPLPKSLEHVRSVGTRRRGFVEEVVLDVPRFLRHAADLFAAVPLRTLELREPTEEEVLALADSPWLGRLRRLRLFMRRVTGPAMRRLGASPHAAGLRSLSVNYALTADAARELAASPLLSLLTHLDVSWNPNGDAVDDILADVIRAGGPTNLARLDVSDCRFGAGPMARLLSSPALGGLVELDAGKNPLRAEGFRAIAESPALAGLRSLRLRDTRPGLPGLRALAGSPHLTNLRRLDLWDDGVGPVAARALAESPLLRGLTVLSLGGNPLGDKGVAALAESPNLAGLALLDLVSCEAGDAGALALARSPHLGGLLRLRWHSDPLGPAARAALRDRFGAGVDGC